MNLRCVHWTGDFSEAHIAVARLRHDGLPAFVADRHRVQLDWFAMLAYGGFRVFVPAAAVDEALGVIARLRRGDDALGAEPGDMPSCPRCSCDEVGDDPLPRRGVFGLLLAGPLLLYPSVHLLRFFNADALETAAAAGVALLVAPIALVLVPGLVSRVVKLRYGCAQCGYRWRGERGADFAMLSSRVDASVRPAAAE